MIVRLVLSLVLLIFVVVTPGTIRAHSPYFSENTEAFDGPDGTKLDLRLLYGDGIIIADPVRAVIIDSHGQLRAVSPLSHAMQIHCSLRSGRRECLAYDELSGMVHESDPKTWRLGGPIFENDSRHRPATSAYPELMTEEFGFWSRQAGFKESLGFEFAKIVKSPRALVLASLWWMMILILIVPILYRIMRPKTLSSRRWYWWVGDLLLRGVCIFVLLGTGFWGYALSPTSILFQGIALLLAVPFAYWLIRQKARLA